MYHQASIPVIWRILRIKIYEVVHEKVMKKNPLPYGQSSFTRKEQTFLCQRHRDSPPAVESADFLCDKSILFVSHRFTAGNPSNMFTLH